MSKALITLALASSLAFASYKANDVADQQVAETRTYSLTIRLNVPRIYDNNESLGYRKYQPQSISGTMELCYSKDSKLVDVVLTGFLNKTHKSASGASITYDAQLDYTVVPRFNVIGNNKTHKFNVASVCFSIAAKPSYAIAPLAEDNSLYLVLAGRGPVSRNALKSLSGNAVGTIGCGCSDYGHLSPTRELGPHGATDVVDDIAAVHGTWKARAAKASIICR